MQKFMCLICLRELSSKRSAKSHLKTAHDEMNEENIQSFDIDYLNIEVKDNAEGDASVLDREEIERIQALDRWFHETNNQERFGDVDALLNQEISENPDIGLGLNIELFVEEDQEVVVDKKKEKKSKKKEEKISYFKPLTNCFNDSNLMEPFHMYEKKTKRNNDTGELHLPSNDVEPSDILELADDMEPCDNHRNLYQGSVNQSGTIRSSESYPQLRRKFKAPYKQSTKGKGTICEFDGCSFCANKSDCGQCVFDLNKSKL